MTSFEQILYDVADGVATVTLNRPFLGVKNRLRITEAVNVRRLRWASCALGLNEEALSGIKIGSTSGAGNVVT